MKISKPCPLDKATLEELFAEFLQVPRANVEERHFEFLLNCMDEEKRDMVLNLEGLGLTLSRTIRRKTWQELLRWLEEEVYIAQEVRKNFPTESKVRVVSDRPPVDTSKPRPRSQSPPPPATRRNSVEEEKKGERPSTPRSRAQRARGKVARVTTSGQIKVHITQNHLATITPKGGGRASQREHPCQSGMKVAGGGVVIQTIGVTRVALTETPHLTAAREKKARGRARAHKKARARVLSMARAKA